MAMLTSTSLFTKSLAPLLPRRTLLLTSPPIFLFKGSKRAAKSETETASSSSSSAVVENDRDISAYRWCATLGGVGFLETAYLTYLKLSDLDAFCPIGEGSCNAILNSDFASIFGVPLPVYGMVAYGLVATLGLQLQLVPQNTDFDILKTKDETILIGITTSMAAATAYFLYILSSEFGEESCLYCLTSSALTFILFFITLKNFGLDKIQKMLGSQLCIASLIVFALSFSCIVVQPVSSSLAATELPYVEKEITKESSHLAISLAKHLNSIGARLYGAFWCSHCVHQKETFGSEAAKLLNYIECYPDGVREGTKMADACLDVDLKSFPSWEINGQILSGEKKFAELAKLSGIKLEDLS